MRVLIVEDDTSRRALLQRVLEEESCVSTLSTTARAGLHDATDAYDVIVLDWMLPDSDGPSFCEALRRANIWTPVLMLTARADVADRVAGLRSGADDYLVKPFEIEELLARLEALVRRNSRMGRLSIGELEIDQLRRRCCLAGSPLDLTVREYELLVRLAVASGAPVSRSTLLQDVWRMEFDPGSGVLDVAVSRLRDKLGDGSTRLETVRGVGYRLRTEP